VSKIWKTGDRCLVGQRAGIVWDVHLPQLEPARLVTSLEPARYGRSPGVGDGVATAEVFFDGDVLPDLVPLADLEAEPRGGER
jgi:hypothetical protein